MSSHLAFSSVVTKDAYFLLVAMQSFGPPSLEAIGICVRVLQCVFLILLTPVLVLVFSLLAYDVVRLLGEDLPSENLELSQIVSAVNSTKEMFERESDHSLLNMKKKTDKRIDTIMKFYSQLGLVSFIATPMMHPFYMSKFAQFCLVSRVDCKYLPIAFAIFGSCLCNGLSSDTMLGHRIGRIGLVLFNRSVLDMDWASLFYLEYYRHLVRLSYLEIPMDE